MDNLFEAIHKLNCLSAEISSLYHHASLRLGVSDSGMIVLQMLHERGLSCPLCEIYKQSGISKQTISSAVRKLENDGIIRLEQSSGRSKNVTLTDKGLEYLKATAVRLYEAERAAYESWTDEEIGNFVRLMQKYAETFREQTELL